MRITIQLPFLVKARAKFTKVHQKFFVSTPEDFEVTEIDGSDAILVASGFAPTTSLNIGDGIAELRYYDDSFWYPEIIDNKIASAEEWSYDRIGVHGTDLQFWKKIVGKPLTTFDRDLFRDIESNTINENRAHLERRLANDIRIIDGRVFTRVPEPYFALTSYGSENTARIIFRNRDISSISHRMQDEMDYSPDVTDIFRFDQYDEMVRTYGDNPKWNFGNRPVIHHEGLFEFDDEAHSLMHRALCLLELGPSQFKDMPSFQAARTWIDIKEARSNALVTKQEEDYQKLADHIELYRDIWKWFPEDQFYRAKALKLSNDIVTRWLQRPINLDYVVKL